MTSNSYAMSAKPTISSIIPSITTEPVIPSHCGCERLQLPTSVMLSGPYRQRRETRPFKFDHGNFLFC